MTKMELIRELADQLPHIPLMTVESIVKDVMRLMANTLEAGDRIEIRGFGSFSLRYRAPRLARNPKTGVQLTTGGKHTVHFKPGKALKERVSQDYQRFPLHVTSERKDEKA